MSATLADSSKGCLLMEEYVALYAKGDRKKLVFLRGVRGGSGRGAVDKYNLLCDLLWPICKDERSEGLNKLGKVHKFLAKDIMGWNNSFAYDAFANGKVPGWEPWLAERRAELEAFSKSADLKEGHPGGLPTALRKYESVTSRCEDSFPLFDCIYGDPYVNVGWQSCDGRTNNLRLVIHI